MSRYVAFLRALNTGKDRTVKMTAIRTVFESLGYLDVATVSVSGNVVFDTTTRDQHALEGEIEKKLFEALGLEITTLIRSGAELAAVAAHRPFPQSAVETATEFNIIFLSDLLDEESIQKLKVLANDENEFHVFEREIYWLRHLRPGGSSFSPVPLNKAVLRPFTIRTENMVMKIVRKYCS